MDSQALYEGEGRESAHKECHDVRPHKEAEEEADRHEEGLRSDLIAHGASESREDDVVGREERAGLRRRVSTLLLADGRTEGRLTESRRSE